MNRLLKFLPPLLAAIAGIIAFNVIIGVLGLHWAAASLVFFNIFAICMNFRPQPEDKEPHA